MGQTTAIFNLGKADTAVMLVTWTEHEMSMASLADLDCIALTDLLELYERKYEAVDRGHVLYALSYFDVADEEPTPMMLWDVDWTTIKTAVSAWVKDEA